MKLFYFAARIVAFAAVAAFAVSTASAEPKKVLFFSKSSGFQHDVIKKNGDQPTFVEKILKELGDKNNIEFTCTKDGTVFTPENIAKYDAFFFHTTGDLTEPGTDKFPPMSPEGKKAFLEAIHNGKGFVGTHCAADTFHSPNYNKGGADRGVDDSDKTDPYIQMLGAEFIIHGSQQKAHQIVIDKNFPGMSAVPADFAPLEEWYSLKNFSPNLHVLLVQDTSTMNHASGGDKQGYDRPNYPSTFAHMYGEGRVFYTSMGHREDVWTNPVFQQVLLGGLNWVLRNVDADVSPNMSQAAPEGNTHPAQ